ncbi:hypothetical protein QTI33_14495 [Variovorax sp. J22P271]|uniref:hypothetical protein n=1 Tax=Variovorax davisae TaxID=3053515 RepID=UPI002575C660|nr:hypothetical protein [Variovorax sp. J22P271]MDM0033341.1 hypothetical protein [Variovorax sp. J22P271]
MKLTKIAIAAAGLALTGGYASAGNFQTNSTVIAQEVVISDAQQIVSPQVSYSFANPVRNPTNDTYFQIQLKLDQGIWQVPSHSGFPSATIDDTPVSPGNVGNVALVNAAGLVIANAWAVKIDDKTIKATFLVPKGPGENNARVVFNANGVQALSLVQPANPATDVAYDGNRIKISGLKTVVGDLVDCTSDIKKIVGTITQYPDITDPAFTATTANSSSSSEDKAPNAVNSGPVASFPVNLKVSGEASSPIAVQNYSQQGKTFQYQSAVGTPQVTASGKTVQLGTVRFDQQAQGYDSDLLNIYGNSTPTGTFVTTATTNTGGVELTNFQTLITGEFAADAKLWLVPAGAANAPTACADTGYAGGVSPVAGSATVGYTNPAGINKGINYAVCYGVGGAAVIPTSAFNARLVLNKAPDGLSSTAAVRFQEQNNACRAQFNVGGGIRIDVRNYASYAKFGNSGTSSTLRIINNSETATADLYAQMIYADGKYGAWGKLPDLAPRAAVNYSNRELESFMTNAAAASNPFGANATNYSSSGGAKVDSHTAAGVGDRVRIVSTTGSTLRVQSYISSGSVMIDTSGAQGVDFEGLAAPLNGRAPTTDAQPNSQDAINGLSR